MQYLFFDVQCCDGRHICELGYAITDEQFIPIVKGNMLINPEKRFNFAGNLHINHTKKDYENAQNFADSYVKIGNILCGKGRKVIGFSTHAHAKILNLACDRYSLPYFEFAHYDLQRAVSQYFNSGKSASLPYAAELLGVDMPEPMHKSEDNALLILLLAKKLCGLAETPLDMLIADSHALNLSADFNEKLSYLTLYPAEFDENSRSRMLHEELKRVQPRDNTIACGLTGKKLCFSLFFARENLVGFMRLVQRVVDCGGVVAHEFSECDYYVRHENDNLKNKRSHYYRMAQLERPGERKVLDISQLLHLLQITAPELSSYEIQPFDKNKK